MWENISIANIDPNICILQLKSVNGLNILNSKMLIELNDAINYLNNINNISVVIIAGSNKAFCAGADIKEMLEMDTVGALEYSKLGISTFMSIYHSEKIYIGAVDGMAFGGGLELLLSCDLRIASTNTRFRNPEVKLGIICGFSGTQMLSRIIGVPRAKDILFSGREICSAEALSIGLVNYTFESENLMDETIVIAKNISQNNLKSLSYTKKLVNYSMESSLIDGLELESQYFSSLFNLSENKGIMEKFITKKK